METTQDITADKILECSNCWCPLVEIKITNHDVDTKWKLIAECPYCGDKSFAFDVKGLYGISYTKYATMVDQNTDGETTVFKMVKGEVQWK